MIVTNASERTQWFHFPLFTKNDKYSFTDWNNTFEELDDILEGMKVKIDAIDQRESKLDADFIKLEDTVKELKSIVTDYTYFFNDLKKDFKELRENQIQLAAEVKEIINQEYPEKFATVEDEIAGLDARVTALENQ